MFSQFVSHEEGRIGILYDNINQPFNNVNATYDYFLQDHRGNTLMVLMGVVKTDEYTTATREDGNAFTDSANNTQVNESRAHGM